MPTAAWQVFWSTKICKGGVGKGGGGGYILTKEKKNNQAAVTGSVVPGRYLHLDGWFGKGKKSG